MGKKIKLISKVNANFNVNFPEFRYNRDFNGEGASQLIDKDVLDELVYDERFARAVRNGVLYIDDKDARVEYGFDIEDNDGNIVETPTILSTEEILKMLQELNFQDFKTKVESLPMSQVQRIVDVAVEHKLIDYAKAQLLKRLTSRDLIKIIELTTED